MMKSEEAAVPRKIFLSLSLVSYVACLGFNSFCLDGTPSGPGLGALLLGIGGLLAPSLGNLTWLANPILFCSWIAVIEGARRAAIYLSLAALALSALFLIAGMVVGEKGPMDITCFGPGYWLWLASTATASISAFLIDPAVSTSATGLEREERAPE
jgi:hypothetical protein